MSDTTSEQTEPDTSKAPEGTEAEPGTEQATTKEPEGQEPAEEPEGEETQTDDLPEWARTKLTNANNDAASYRVKLREAEQKLANVADLDEVKAIVNAMTAEREEAENKAAEEIRSLLAENVARKFGLPDKFAKKLSGSTREELEADATEFAEFVVGGAPADLEGGLSPRDRDEDANLSPRELAKKYGSRRTR